VYIFESNEDLYIIRIGWCMFTYIGIVNYTLLFADERQQLEERRMYNE
jgi:hypothetical protein